MQNYTTKYRINYGNSFGDSFECFIKIRGNYTGDVIPLEGYCDLRYKAITNPFEPIRGASLQIKINVTIDNPLEELSIITEFEYFAEFYRNNEHLFSGWINPDGVFQDWVTDAWQVSLTAVDGLGFLKNYEFETNGLKPQEFNYLYAILRRLNYAIPIATFDDVNLNFNAQGLPTNRDFTNADRRVVSEGVFENKNDRNLDCETVLKDILLKYNFTIQQATVNGNLVWMISRLPMLLTPGNRKGQVWGFSSITNGQPNWTVLNTFESVQATIKTHSEPIEADAFHVNQNQQISFTPALQNFRFETRWKGLFNQLPIDLRDYFTITDPNARAFFTPPTATGGNLYPFLFQAFNITVQSGFFNSGTSNEMPLDSNRSYNLIFGFNYFMGIENIGPQQNVEMIYQCKIIWRRTGFPTQYLKLNGNVSEWSDSDSVLFLNSFLTEGINYPINEGGIKFFTEIETPTVAGGTIQIILSRPKATGISTNQLVINWQVTELITMGFNDPLLGLGEYHDATRVNFASSFLQEPQKVINSNHNEGFFTNNLYRRNGINLVPQNQWQTPISQAFQDLLNLTSRERVNILQRPQMIFRGDIFGYIPYWCLINYTTIDGNFVARDYRYNTKDNVITLECHQIFQGIVNQNYEKSYIFDDERNVLIKS
jgi:hypothetical protein